MRKRLFSMFIVIGSVSIIFAILLEILKSRYNLTLFLFHINTKKAVSFFIILAIISFASLIMLLLKMRKIKRTKHQWMYTFLSVLIIFIILCSCTYTWLAGFMTSPTYVALKSPDNKHEIVIEEESFLLAGYGSFYEKVSPIFMKQIGEYSADDGYRPFSDGHYTAKWHDDGLTVNYSFGANGIYKDEEMHYTIR